MNKLVAAMALATLIASPAVAQSYDPHLGSGNIVRPIPGQAGPLARRVMSPAPPFRAFASARPVAPRFRTERTLFERAKRSPQVY
jgi:hypothetical protein